MSHQLLMSLRVVAPLVMQRSDAASARDQSAKRGPMLWRQRSMSVRVYPDPAA